MQWHNLFFRNAKLLAMNVIATAALVIAACATSCEAGPQRSNRADTLRAKAGPGDKVMKPDSPADARMPVMRTDTARQENMPVAQPPKNVQPK